MTTPVIWPITEYGSSDRPSDLLRYAVRDFYGVESPAATLTDLRGFNDAPGFTRRQYAAAVGEHAASGVHDTVKVPRLLCSILVNGLGVATFYEPSYSQEESTGVIRRGSAVGTAAGAGAGLVDVTLAAPLPGASGYKLLDLTPGWVDLATSAVYQTRVMLDTVTDAQHFRVKRLYGANATTLAATYGYMLFAIYY